MLPPIAFSAPTHPRVHLPDGFHPLPLLLFFVIHFIQLFLLRIASNMEYSKMN
jgi:hypothetical protein